MRRIYEWFNAPATPRSVVLISFSVVAIGTIVRALF